MNDKSMKSKCDFHAARAEYLHAALEKIATGESPDPARAARLALTTAGNYALDLLCEQEEIE